MPCPRLGHPVQYLTSHSQWSMIRPAKSEQVSFQNHLAFYCDGRMNSWTEWRKSEKSMSLTMAHTGNGNITHSSNQTPRLNRRGSMGINYAPYISLVFMPHVRRKENDSANQTPAKQRMASLTHMITKLLKLINSNHTHTHRKHKTVLISSYWQQNIYMKLKLRTV